MQNTTYNLSVFDENDSSLSFKEWRGIIAAKTKDENNSDDSNMEKIDQLFSEFVASLKAADGEVQAYASMLLEQYKKESAALIDKDENGNIVIGLGSDVGNNVLFNDGLGTGLINGVLSTVALELQQYLRLKSYIVKELEIDGVPHLRLSYSPITEEV